MKRSVDVVVDVLDRVEVSRESMDVRVESSMDCRKRERMCRREVV